MASKRKNKGQQNALPAKQPRDGVHVLDAQQDRDGDGIVRQEVSYQGPLPPPALLRQYNELIPGSAEELIAQFRAETAHRHNLQTKIVEGQLARQDAEGREIARGQFFGLIIGIVALGCGTAIAILAHGGGAQVSASVIGGGGVIGLVSVFILGRQHKQSPERPIPPKRPRQ